MFERVRKKGIRKKARAFFSWEKLIRKISRPEKMHPKKQVLGKKATGKKLPGKKVTFKKVT